jgi:hypothetical protein
MKTQRFVVTLELHVTQEDPITVDQIVDMLRDEDILARTLLDALPAGVTASVTTLIEEKRHVGVTTS